MKVVINKGLRNCHECNAQNYKTKYEYMEGKYKPIIYEISISGHSFPMCKECLKKFIIILQEESNEV